MSIRVPATEMQKLRANSATEASNTPAVGAPVKRARIHVQARRRFGSILVPATDMQELRAKSATEASNTLAVGAPVEHACIYVQTRITIRVPATEIQEVPPKAQRAVTSRKTKETATDSERFPPFSPYARGYTTHAQVNDLSSDSSLYVTDFC